MDRHFIVFYIAYDEEGNTAFGDKAVKVEGDKFPSRKSIYNLVKFDRHIETTLAEVQITNILRITEKEYEEYLANE